MLLNENLIENIEHSELFTNNCSNAYLLYYELDNQTGFEYNSIANNPNSIDFSNLIENYNEKLENRITIVEIENYDSDNESSESSSMSVSDSSREGSLVRDVSMFNFESSVDSVRSLDTFDEDNLFSSSILIHSPLEYSTPVKRLKNNGKPYKKKNRRIKN